MHDHSPQNVNFQYGPNQHTGRNLSVLHLCHRWHLSSTTYLLARFGQLTLSVFVKNEAISFGAISKRSTNTELETDISQNVHFQLYRTYRRIT